MSADGDLLFDYSAEVLDFGFGNAGAYEGAPDRDAASASSPRMAERVRAAWVRSGRRRLVLLGLGAGALAADLAQTLPAGTLCVAELDAPRVRALFAAGRLTWRRRGGSARLAVDASPWALFFLLDRAGFGPGDVLVLPNPELPPAAKARFRDLELLLVRARPAAIPAAAPFPRLSCAAILAPGEPDLPGFFAQFPDWIAELVLVWDAAAAPDVALPARVPVRGIARRLGRDFAAQRNAMLAACRGEWVLFLDADERLSPAVWAALPRLAATPGVAGWNFPRLSPYPTADRALMGFGLWPDIQLRLFRNAPGLRFVHPVHERLTGIGGAQGLAPDLEIEHLARLRKDAAALRAKLAGFDAAANGGVRHVLSAEYPSLPRALLAGRTKGPVRGFVLPVESGSAGRAA